MQPHTHIHDPIGDDPIFPNSVFPDTASQKAFMEWSQINDNITPCFISREKFQELKGEFFIKNQDGFLLMLPEDLKTGEIISILSNKKLSNPEQLNKIVALTQWMIHSLLNHGKEEKFGITEGEIFSLAEYLGFDEASRNIIRNSKQDIAFGEKKGVLRKIKDIHKAKGKSPETISERKYDYYLAGLQEIYAQELDTMLFYRGKELLRIGLETISLAELDTIKVRQQELEERFHGIDAKEVITIRNEEVDKVSQKLRDKIGIDKLKSQLKDVREKGNLQEIAEMELGVAHKILHALQEYPYIRTIDERGYQPFSIAKFKEIYCVGFSIIGHIFFSELGIEHKALQIPNHSALSLKIGSKEYYFSGSGNNTDLEEMQWGSTQKYASNKPLLNSEGKSLLPENSEGYNGDPEVILQSQMYYNKGVLLYKGGSYEESLQMFTKAILLNPRNIDAYEFKGNALFKLGKTDEAAEVWKQGVNLL